MSLVSGGDQPLFKIAYLQPSTIFVENKAWCYIGSTCI